MDTIALRRYTTYLDWHVCATVGSAALYAVPAVLYPSIQTTWLALVCMVSSVFAVVARHMNTRHQLQHSLLVLYIQLLALPVAFALILPVMYPVVAYVPVLVVAITLPLLSQRIITRSMVACGTSTVVTVALGVIQPLFRGVSFDGSLLNVVIVVSYGMVTALTYTLLWRYKVHLQTTLDQLADSNMLLEQERAALEVTVQQRTAELQQTLRERDEAYQALHDQAIRDSLTGLFNRRYVDEMLAMEIQRSMRSGLPVGVLLIDLDYFKQVNDTYGHDAGDAVLQGVAALLEDQVRSGDIVGRYGGEEFIMVLPGIPLEPLTSRAEAICMAMRSLEIAHNGQYLSQRSCSIGVALYPDDGGTPDAVVKAADTALYAAKHAGRDQVVVATGISTPLS